MKMTKDQIIGIWVVWCFTMFVAVLVLLVSSCGTIR